MVPQVEKFKPMSKLLCDNLAKPHYCLKKLTIWLNFFYLHYTTWWIFIVYQFPFILKYNYQNNTFLYKTLYEWCLRTVMPLLTIWQLLRVRLLEGFYARHQMFSRVTGWGYNPGSPYNTANTIKKTYCFFLPFYALLCKQEGYDGPYITLLC